MIVADVCFVNEHPDVFASCLDVVRSFEERDAHTLHVHPACTISTTCTACLYACMVYIYMQEWDILVVAADSAGHAAEPNEQTRCSLLGKQANVAPRDTALH